MLLGIADLWRYIRGLLTGEEGAKGAGFLMDGMVSIGGGTGLFRLLMTLL